MEISERELADTVSLFAKSSEAVKPPTCAFLEVKWAWRLREEEGVEATVGRARREERAQEDAIAATHKIIDRKRKQAQVRVSQLPEMKLTNDIWMSLAMFTHRPTFLIIWMTFELFFLWEPRYWTKLNCFRLGSPLRKSLVKFGLYRKIVSSSHPTVLLVLKFPIFSQSLFLWPSFRDCLCSQCVPMRPITVIAKKKKKTRLALTKRLVVSIFIGATWCFAFSSIKLVYEIK